MTELSREKQDSEREKREEAINEWLKLNPSCQIKNRVLHAQHRGVKKPFPVYTLPRHLLRKNPNNWRFRAEYKKIEGKRVSDNKSAELDIENPDDMKIIVNLIKGINPENKWKNRNFELLLEDFKKKAASTRGNGQDDPALVTWDGIYINGNRRDTILEELYTNSKRLDGTGIDASQFQTILVARLPADTTILDIKKNELREQLSRDTRELYSYTNNALLVFDSVDSIVKNSGVSLKLAFKEVAESAFERDEKEMQEFYDYIKTVDKLLKFLKRDGDYDYIENNEDGSTGTAGIVVILKELKAQERKILEQGEWSGVEEEKLIEALYLFAWHTKEKLTRKDPKTGKEKPMKEFSQNSWRQFGKIFDDKQATKKFLTVYPDSKIDWKDVKKSAEPFADAIERAKNISNLTTLVNNPLVQLERAATNLSQVESAMNGTHASAIKKQIKKEGGEKVIKDIESHIALVKRKLKQN